ncbi:MAG: AEC family transporter [Anaerolineae bacterium]|nr:AEC family transporter [Anaerolineae bacterium]
MSAVLEVAYRVILPIMLIIGASALVGRRFKPDPRAISTLMIYMLSPILVIDSLAKARLEAAEVGQSVALALILYVFMALIGWGLARVFRFDRALTSAFVLTVVLLNAGNFGLPLNRLAFGEAGQQRAVIFYVMSAVAANTIGVYLASSGSVSTRRALMNVLKVPLPYALALGLAMNAGIVAPPQPVTDAIDLLADAANPIMLALLGVNIAHTSIKGRAFPILLAASTRLVVAPLLAFPLSALLGMSGLTQQVAIIQSSMPTAVISVVLSTEFKSDPEFASAVVLFGTLASIVTLSVLLTLVT